MNDSVTSSELDGTINYLDNKGNNMNKDTKLIKKDTTETDLYLNMVANTNKVLQESEKSSSSLKLENNSENNSSVINSSSKTSVSSKVNFEEIQLPNRNDNNNHNDNHNDTFNNNLIDSIVSNNSNHSNESTHSRRSNIVETETNTIENNVTENNVVSPEPVLTPQQLRLKKIELLRKLSELKHKGYKLSKEYDFNSKLEDMEYEYDLLKSFANKRNGIKLYKNVLLNACSVTEFLNDKYDPFNFQLSGWSEHMSVEVDSYDDVLEELYEKYKGKGGKMAPEMKLLLLILASASAFHFSKAHLSNIPGLDKVLKNNPDMISKLVAGKEKSSQFMTEQELNIERQRAELQEKERQMKQQLRDQQIQNQRLKDQLLKNNEIHQDQLKTQQENKQQVSSNESYRNAHHPINLNAGHPNNLIPNNDVRPIPKIVKNDTVSDILGRLHSRDNNDNDTETQEETSNNDRIVSDSETKKRGRKKKTLMQVL
jgi:hypothetical protein